MECSNDNPYTNFCSNSIEQFLVALYSLAKSEAGRNKLYPLLSINRVDPLKLLDRSHRSVEFFSASDHPDYNLWRANRWPDFAEQNYKH